MALANGDALVGTVIVKTGERVADLLLTACQALRREFQTKALREPLY